MKKLGEAKDKKTCGVVCYNSEHFPTVSPLHIFLNSVSIKKMPRQRIRNS